MAKIELGRAYQTLTGEWVVVHPKEVLFSAESCFHANTLEQYAEYVDSLRHSYGAQEQECCVENTDLVSAAIEGNLEKVKEASCSKTNFHLGSTTVSLYSTIIHSVYISFDN